ncbi:MAG: hypothetical protein PHU85_17245 [Phycisphaerae bacterium]|nr:hypothetical protein [Phycisphaerae bacterium]
MRFIKITLPVIAAFLMAVVGILSFFSSHRYSMNFMSEWTVWGKVIGGVTMFLGTYSILRLHYVRIRRQQPGWGYSALLFVFFVLIVVFGILNDYGDWPHEGLAPIMVNGKQATGPNGRPLWVDVAGKQVEQPLTGLQGPTRPQTPAPDGTAWLYQWVAQPAGATVFATLGFFICSAAYRTFRAKTPEAAVLLVAALIVMIGQVPLAAVIANWIPTFSGWLLEYPNMAVKRAILFGICLGSVGTSLRVMFGIERSYLGGDK